MSKEKFKPEDPAEQGNEEGEMKNITPVRELYKGWFLDYASYVILDRAVPYLEDGLKPVQRRILHAMKEMDDGRFNKVANIIGQTMQYHPHGDAAIGEAIINLGQKDLLIETQGNWGNVVTGDSAAAPRYIEARLSKFALEVAFNSKTTNWQLSYDGRKDEPILLPMKFPLLLAQGVEGIAVGLSTKILPHNFCELIQASIAYLRGRRFEILPDFPTGGLLDPAEYNHGERGGRVKVRARIQELDKKTLVINEIPYGTTTTSLIESIIKANDRGKIKIKHIDDNTARDVEIVIHLAPGVSPGITIDALYAFTDCQVSISPNCCVITQDKPVFTNVRELLKLSADHTVELLKMELEIRKGELNESWHMASLEKIFIEKRIYRSIEECETWEAVIETIDKGLKPYKKNFHREITREDIEKLTEIRIKRISKYNTFEADRYIKGLEDELKQVNHHLKNLVDYAVAYFENLLAKYGKGRERKTEIKTFDTIEVKQVAIANQKLYMNAEDGFIGTSLRKDTFVCDCSDIDDIVIFRADGVMQVTKVSDKTFVGKNILHAGVLKKNDDRMVYHMVYLDSADKRIWVKRFQVKGVVRDKEYCLTRSGKPGKVLYFTANANGESEVVTVKLKPKAFLKKKEFDFDFATIGIKGRDAGGNLLSSNDVSKVIRKSVGASTLGGRDLWFDDAVNRLNTDSIGPYLGNFIGDDRLIALYDDGSYELTTFDLTNRYDGKGKLLDIAKLTPETVVSAIYLDGESKNYYVKRFKVETTSVGQKFAFISESPGSKLIFASAQAEPVVKVKYANTRAKDDEIKLETFIDVKGWKAIGNKLTDQKVRAVELVSFKAVVKAEPTEEPAEPEAKQGSLFEKEESSADKKTAKKSAEADTSKKKVQSDLFQNQSQQKNQQDDPERGSEESEEGFEDIPFEIEDKRGDDPTLF